MSCEVKWSYSVCPTFCNPMDCSPPGSSVHGIFQARILEWVAISFSRSRDLTQASHIAGRYFTFWATREALRNNAWPMEEWFGELWQHYFLFSALNFKLDTLPYLTHFFSLSNFKVNLFYIFHFLISLLRNYISFLELQSICMMLKTKDTFFHNRNNKTLSMLITITTWKCSFYATNFCDQRSDLSACYIKIITSVRKGQKIASHGEIMRTWIPGKTCYFIV